MCAPQVNMCFIQRLLSPAWSFVSALLEGTLTMTLCGPDYNTPFFTICIAFEKVAYGDFTGDANTQTTFICPELTMRQLQRLPSVRGFATETVGRVHPIAKVSDSFEQPHKSRRLWLGPLTRRGTARDNPTYERMASNMREGGQEKMEGPGVPVSLTSSASDLLRAGRLSLQWQYNTSAGERAYTPEPTSGLLSTPVGRVAIRM